jgi:hypothetical protein
MPGAICRINYDMLAKVLREGLRERLETESKLVLRGKDIGSTGVGCPFVVEDPDTRAKKLLFLAIPSAGQPRVLYVVDIDDDLVPNLRTLKRVAAPSDFDPSCDGMDSISAFWDDYNEQWIIFTSPWGGAGVIFADKDFNLRGRQFLSAPSGVTIYGGANKCLLPLWDRKALFVAPQNVKVDTTWFKGRLFWLDDFTKRPLPTLTLLGTHSAVGFPDHLSIELEHTFIFGGVLTMIFETNDYAGGYSLGIAFSPMQNWGRWWGGWNLGKWIMAISEKPFHVPHHQVHFVDNIGHPHFTTAFGKPMLFYAHFTFGSTGGARSMAHEIWASVIRPEQLDPRNNFPLAVRGTDVDKGAIFGTYGAKTAVVQVYGASAAGTLTVKHSTSVEKLAGGTSIDESYSIPSGNSRIIINAPGPYMAITTDVSISSWTVYLLA